MPYLTIRTNQSLEEQKGELLRKVSTLLARQLGKSENFVMVSVEAQASMLFAGSSDPAAYLELKSLGLPEQKLSSLSDALCSLLEQETGIPRRRIYIEFSSPDRQMWGWNGSTF